MNSGNEQQALGLLVFVKLVAIAFPGGGKRLGALFIKKLFQYLQPSEFAHQVFVDLFPLLPKVTVDGWKCHWLRNVTRLIEVGMHDLLRRCRRVQENLSYRAPTRRLYRGR